MARPIADLIHFNSTTVTASGDVYYGPGGGTGIGPIARPIEHGLDSSTENGWQEFESYADLGVDPRRYVPLQVKEKRREIELQFRDAEKNLRRRYKPSWIRLMPLLVRQRILHHWTSSTAV